MSCACNRLKYENEYICFTTVLTTNRLHSNIQTHTHYITTNVVKALAITKQLEKHHIHTKTCQKQLYVCHS